MRRELWAKLALGCAGIFTSGGLMGVGLANYVESGSFHFYREASARAWESKTEIRPIDFAAEAPLGAPHEAGLLQQASLGP
jgi:hypothetical protein